jgi:branched-chain amino acid transport system substrate-binding protein
VAKTPLVGGQWQKSAKGFELVVVENSQASMVPVAAKFLALK